MKGERTNGAKWKNYSSKSVIHKNSDFKIKNDRIPNLNTSGATSKKEKVRSPGSGDDESSEPENDDDEETSSEPSLRPSVKRAESFSSDQTWHMIVQSTDDLYQNIRCWELNGQIKKGHTSKI